MTKELHAQLNVPRHEISCQIGSCTVLIEHPFLLEMANRQHLKLGFATSSL
jgi:hypothetical protein